MKLPGSRLFRTILFIPFVLNSVAAAVVFRQVLQLDGTLNDFVQMIFGILGGIGADMRNLVFMKETADKLFGKDYQWSVLAAGKNQMGFCTQAALMGGNVRVGLEDSLYIGKGKLATSNAEQVRKIRTIIEELGLEVATPAEARAMLALKGGDRVAF